MSELLLIAILNFASKVGIDATIAFLRNKGATLDDAITALELASEKSLAEYKAEDKAK